MHIHGLSFAILKVGYPPFNTSTGHRDGQNGDIKCESPWCNKMSWARDVTDELNLVNPPIRDTIVVPALGYVVLRFRAWNPGQ